METHASIIWEQAHKVIFLDRNQYPEDAQMTEDDFMALLSKLTPQVDYQGLDWWFRCNWLIENGYDVTQDNLVDNTLRAQPEVINNNPDIQAVYDNLPQEYWDTRDALQQQIDVLDNVITTAAADPNTTVDLATSALSDVASVVSIATIQPSPIQPAPLEG